MPAISGKIVLIVQARMESTRLPGKVLRNVEGKPLLQFQLERLRRVQGIDRIVIATTLNQADNQIEKFCKHMDVDCYRGSEDDVLSRYFEAAMLYRADTAVRVTSDCPLIDPKIIEKVIQAYRSVDSHVDYASNTLVRSYPRGMDVEVFSMKVLREAFENATNLYEREHVTPFIYQHNERYRLLNIAHEADESRHRWTVDTKEDFELISRMLNALAPSHPFYSLEDCLELLRRYPEWRVINAHIEQKKIG
jgi:spore coat polysaccharide biosynthesis protein SpsF